MLYIFINNREVNPFLSVQTSGHRSCHLSIAILDSLVPKFISVVGCFWRIIVAKTDEYTDLKLKMEYQVSLYKDNVINYQGVFAINSTAGFW